MPKDKIIFSFRRNELKNNLEFCLELKLRELDRDSSHELVNLARDKLVTFQERKSGFAEELKKIETDLEVFLIAVSNP